MFKPYFFAALILFAKVAVAAEVQAIPNATEVTEDENVSVDFRVTVEGVAGVIGSPRYDAPDFDEVNAYATTQRMESAFVNGQITVRHTRSVTVVLHPQDRPARHYQHPGSR
jgi:hypothetical protein